MSKKKVRIGVLVSGNGSNLQAILDATQSGLLSEAEVVLVISNKQNAFALERAKRSNVEGLFLDPSLFSSREIYFEKMMDLFERKQVDLICLAGFLLKLENNIVRQFKNRILNIHPALLPQFGGKGMYGHYVHEAVLKSGMKESGCTVHVVDEEFDHGHILLQRKVPVLSNDTKDSLAARILKEEHLLYPEAVRLYIQSQFQTH